MIMESPRSSKNISMKDWKGSTPKQVASKMNQDSFRLYGLHRECSPNAYACSQDTLEIGWGDSPEPLKNLPASTTPVACKRKLESRESPRSSNTIKSRRARPSFIPPSKPPVDVSKYVAELQQLTRTIMEDMEKKNEKGAAPSSVLENISESVLKQNVPSPNLNNDVSNLLKDDDSLNECLIACTQKVEMNLQNEVPDVSPIAVLKTGVLNLAYEENDAEEVVKERKEFFTPKRPVPLRASEASTKDSSFDKVLQSFNNEDDDWLSQVIVHQEPKKTPGKGNFVKSRSENQLVSPCVETATTSAVDKKTSKLMNSSFRRSCSFDISKNSEKSKREAVCSEEHTTTNETVQPLKKQKSFTFDSEMKNTVTKCSLEEIERKRLEAKFRKERKEIERRKLEAQRLKEMKKMGLRSSSQTK